MALNIRVFLALGIAFGCGGARPQADPVILALGDQEVRLSEFEGHVRSLEAQGGGAMDATVREAVFEPFVEEKVLVLEARSRGLVKAASSPAEEAEAVARLLEAAVPLVEVTPAEVEGYFREHASELQTPETVTLRQILVPTANEARDVKRRLAKEPRSFENLARTRSRGPEASTGGLMGRFSRGQLPSELEEAAFSLAQGGVSEIVATPLGHHVLRLDAREAARETTLAACEERIRGVLERKKSEQSVRAFLRDVMSRAKVNHEAAKGRTRPTP